MPIARLLIPSLHLARTSLAGRPGRTALLIAAVAMASSLLVAVSCAVRSAQASLERDIQRHLGATDARVIHRFAGRFEADVLDTARSWPGVALATARLGGALTLVHEDMRRDPETGRLLRATLSTIGVDFTVDARFRETELTEGRVPTTANEVLFDPMSAERLQAKLGDRLIVQRFGEPVELEIVGMYERRSLGTLQRPQILVPIDTLREAGNMPGQVSSVQLILDEGIDIIEFCQRHANDLEDHLTVEPAERVRAGFDRRVRASRLGFTIAAVVAFMSSAFIIVTGLTTAVTQKQREMAVTRCIGAMRSQLFLAQIWVGLALGVIGAAVGIPIGIGLAAILVWWFRELLPAGLAVSELGVGLTSIGSISAGLIGAIYPAFIASRVTPLSAMAVAARPVRFRTVVACTAIGLTLVVLQVLLMGINDPQQRFWVYAFAGMPLVHLGYFALAVPLLIAVVMLSAGPITAVLRLPAGMLRRSVLATPFRHGFTAGAIMVGVSILVSTWSAGHSLLNDWLGRIRFADGFALRTTGISPEQQRAIAALPFVQQSCPIGYMSVRVLDRHVFGVESLTPPNVVAIGFDPRVFFEMNAVEWAAGDPATAIDALVAGRGIIVADQFFNTRKVKLGDTLTLGSGPVRREFEVVGAVSSAGLDIATQVFGIRDAYMEYAVSCVFLDFQTYVEAFGNPEAIIMQLSLSPDVTDRQVERAVARAAPDVMFRSGRWIKKQINEIAAAAFTVNATIALCALLLACFGVGNVILANIHARQFEYGVLRAVGAGRGVLLRLIIGEAVLLALAGALTGTLLGLHLAWVATVHYRDLAGLPIRVTLPWLPVGIGWSVVLILTVAAALPAALSLMRRAPLKLLASGRGA